MANENPLPFDPDKVPDLIGQGLIRVVGTPASKTHAEPPLPTNESMEKAREIMGTEFFGVEEVEKAFGFPIDKSLIPKMEFTPQELTEAKANDQYLMLYVPKKADGTPITAKLLTDTLQPQFDRDRKGKIQYDTDWCKNEKFYTTDTSRPAWRLITKDVVPGSLNNNYLQQTEDIVKYLKDVVFKGKSIPTDYQEAIDEFEGQKENIRKNLSSKWQESANKLAGLKITKKTRQTLVEERYGWLVYFQNRNERLLEDKYNWTGSQSSDGNLVNVGVSDSDGAYVVGWGPGYSRGSIGVVLSR